MEIKYFEEINDKMFETCEEIIKKNGKCIGIYCSNCPFDLMNSTKYKCSNDEKLLTKCIEFLKFKDNKTEEVKEEWETVYKNEEKKEKLIPEKEYEKLKLELINLKNDIIDNIINQDEIFLYDKRNRKAYIMNYGTEETLTGKIIGDYIKYLYKKLDIVELKYYKEREELVNLKEHIKNLDEESEELYNYSIMYREENNKLIEELKNLKEENKQLKEELEELEELEINLKEKESIIKKQNDFIDKYLKEIKWLKYIVSKLVSK